MTKLQVLQSSKNHYRYYEGASITKVRVTKVHILRRFENLDLFY